MTATSPVTAAPGAKIILGRRRPEDHEALERMYAGVFGVGAARRSRDRWRWQYEENPHCPPEGPEIWVAKEAGRILGQYATMPVRLKVKDRILRASWGMDVMVRPDLQRQGIGSRLFLYWDQHVEASLGLGLSVASYTLFKKLQWEDVGPVPCYTRILDPAAVMARRIGERPARLLAPLGRAVLGLAFPTRVSRAAEAAVDVTRLEAAFGEDFDRLWDRASSSYDFITERRADYLEWKFRKVPYLDYDIFQALRGSEVAGYMVLRATERKGVRLGLLVDWFAHPQDAPVLDALLDRASTWGRENQIARLQTFTFDRRLAACLRRKGFFQIGSPMQFCLRVHSGHVDPSFFKDVSRWHVTFGDSDQDRDP